jgi:alginate O-acetyltransferase complex protein AlgI
VLFYHPTYIFIFLPICILIYYLIPLTLNKSKIFLIFISLIFYSWWSINYLPIIIFSIMINYFFTKKIKFNKNKKITLFFAISFNILLLLFCKYLDFFILNINYVFDLDISYFNFPFPLAISFITFQTIAFLVNCYDKEIKKIKLIDYALFISFFPQLVAGPIVKYNNMLPQFNNKKNKSFILNNFSLGLIIFAIGLFKKIVLASNLEIFVNESFLDISNLGFLNSWIASISFTFQIYFDFSGYVDMATGSALMLNIILPINFNSPYKSKSIIEFWQRWHITLTNFLTNFIYTPWLKSFKNITFLKSTILIFLVFLIAGLWHGPSWNFVVFGVIHGFGLIINNTYRRFLNYHIPNFFSWIITFLYINFSFIFFRIQSLDEALVVCKNLFMFNNFELPNNLDNSFIVVFIFSFLLCLFFKNTYNLIEKNIFNKKNN